MGKQHLNIFVWLWIIFIERIASFFSVCVLDCGVWCMVLIPFCFSIKLNLTVMYSHYFKLRIHVRFYFLDILEGKPQIEYVNKFLFLNINFLNLVYSCKKIFNPGWSDTNFLSKACFDEIWIY